MSDNLHELKSKIDRLELLVSFLMVNEISKGDPKFTQLLKVLLKNQPSGYFDDLWDKYKSVIAEDSSKLSQIEILNERISQVNKLFNDLKNSTDEMSEK